MKTTFAKSSHRSPTYTNFATPLVLDPPRHCGLPSIQLGLGKHLLGTSHDCSVRVRAEDVGPRHALIVVGEHRTVVKALDPRTWVNEGPVSEMALRPGDRLSIGPLTFRVRAASPDELADFATTYDQTFDDDGPHDADVVLESPMKSPSFVNLVDETQQAVVSTRATTAVFPVADSISTEVRDPVVPTPVQLPNVAPAIVAVTSHEPSHTTSSWSSVEQAAPQSDVPVNAPVHTVAASAARSSSIRACGRSAAWRVHSSR